MSDAERIAYWRSQGHCCAQVQVQMGLEWLGEENQQLLQAAGGLCGGIRKGLACGALTGAVIMLGLFDPALAKDEMAAEMVDWFSEEYGKDGDVNCLSILDGDMSNRHRVCDALIRNTCLAAKEILEDRGFDMLEAGG